MTAEAAAPASVTCWRSIAMPLLSRHRFHGFRPITKKKTAVALFVSFVTDDCKTAAECRLQRLAVVALHSECLTSLLGILLPLVDGVRDGDTFDDFEWLCFPAQYTCHALGTQPPLCI